MPEVTLPYTFTNGPGNVIDATQVMANYNVLRDAVNDLTIENTRRRCRRYWCQRGRQFVSPVILGAGTPYFPPLPTQLDLELVETRTFGSGVVYLRHRRC